MDNFPFLGLHNLRVGAARDDLQKHRLFWRLAFDQANHIIRSASLVNALGNDQDYKLGREPKASTLHTSSRGAHEHTKEEILFYSSLFIMETKENTNKRHRCDRVTSTEKQKRERK
ncbi:unnamed protein product [Eruca vesicaria subsp. sativa]|uniref:Uncharacterized protein n=1 Tax=Eruca vesicaria subsp. sativa TaxID=29727 RepID=A0ABC8J296_ERUVS|nr:unnamed protein product [Eruca vesicaria subsp. sativa]